MDDEPVVGVLDGPAHVGEQVEPGLDGQPAVVAVGVDGLALDDLHREVGEAVGRRAPVEEPGDGGVLEPGEDGPLAEEPPDDDVGVEPPLEQLERDALVERPVGPLGEVHDAHPAAPDLAHDPVRPDAAARGVVGAVVEAGGEGGAEGDEATGPAVEEAVAGGFGGQEPVEAGAEGVVAVAGPVEERRAGLPVEVEGLGEEPVDVGPVERLHRQGASWSAEKR